jgi:hypothetical protein
VLYFQKRNLVVGHWRFYLDLEDYVTASQAAEILTRNSGREVRSTYVRQLVRYGKLTPIKMNKRINLYSRSEVERIIVEDRGGKHEQHRKPKQSDTAVDENSTAGEEGSNQEA